MATGTAWGAVLCVARSELRRRWRGMVVLGILAGIAGAVVCGAVAVSRRTASVYDRLVDATLVEDARVVMFTRQIPPERITGLPNVTASRVLYQAVAAVRGQPFTYVAVSAGPPSDELLRPVIVSGRAPRDGSDDEAVIAEALSKENGVGVGDTVPLKMLTPVEVTQFDTGFGEPDGPALQLKITGIARLGAWAVGNGLSPLISTPAFAERYRDSMVGTTVLLRLADTSPDARQALRERLAAIADTVEPPPGAEEFEPLGVTFPTAQPDPAVIGARGALVGGLLVFIAVCGLAGLLAVAQGLGRHHALGAGDQRIEAAIGLTPRERLLARLLPGGVGAAIATVVTVGGVLVASWVEPLGALRGSEPTPGWLPNWTVVTLGGLGVGLTFLAMTAWTSARALAEPHAGPGAAGLPRALALVARRAPTVAGTAFALTAGRGRSSVPVRTTIVSAVVGIAGVVAAASFAASLHRLAETPARFGWAADFALVDAKDADLGALLADRRVGAVQWVEEGALRLDRDTVTAFSVDPLKGNARWTLLEGRLPRAPGEVSVGPKLAEAEGVGLGDSLHATNADGRGVSLRVVGLALAPKLGNERFAGAAILTPDGLAAAQQGQPFNTALVSAADPAESDALFAQLNRRFELTKASAPDEVGNLIDLGRLPDALGIFLAAVAAAVLAHALVLTTRRRSRDLAVLRAIGFTPGQVAASLMTMALTTAVVGLVLGVPLGLGIARLVWWEVATGVGVAGDLLVPAGLLLVLVPAVLLGSVVVALLPARRAARLSPAEALRSE